MSRDDDPVEAGATVAVQRTSRGAWILAVLDVKSTSVRREVLRDYEVAMERLLAKCPETEQQIADVVVVGAKDLLEHGVTMSHSQLMAGVNASMPADVKKALGVRCAEIVAILMTTLQRQ